MPISHELLTEAEAVQPLMVELRRAIHREPELGLENPMTQQRILDSLAPLGLPVTVGRGLSSVVATITGAEPGPTVLLRADTDALPMTEDTDWDHRSRIEGRAHVCGHDAHVAMLLGAAHLLVAHRDEIRGTVRLAFQPGEEGSGGMAHMIDEGLLVADDLGGPAEAAFALHITPNLPVGTIGTRSGPFMASTDDFRIDVIGRGGHASQPHFANDPVPVAAEMILALQTMITRTVNAFDPGVLTVGHLEAGSTTNVIPQKAWFEGTIRTVSEGTRATVRAGLERVVRGVAAAHDCEVLIDLRSGYPVTVNHAGVTSFVKELAAEVMGPRADFPLPWPVMGAEDVSYLFNEIPGAMAFLGVCPADIANSLEAPACHSNLMRLEESAMPYGAAMHAAFALGWARRPQ